MVTCVTYALGTCGISIKIMHNKKKIIRIRLIYHGDYHSTYVCDCLIESTTMEFSKGVLLVELLLSLYALKLSTADCQGKCEQSSGSFGQTGIKHRAILGHTFKNFTVKKTFDCHVKCFDERCRCQAYQMWNNRCELLDEDRSSAPDDFANKWGYSYFDMDNEFVKQVRDMSSIIKN